MNRDVTTGPAIVPGSTFGSVFAGLKPHMSALDDFLRLQVEAFEPEIRSMADYCIDTSGKRIRPALVFLSGWNQQTTPAADLVKAAAVVELVHLATLVHDDIMDGADMRRNRDTAARKFGPTAAAMHYFHMLSIWRLNFPLLRFVTWYRNQRARYAQERLCRRCDADPFT